MEQWSVSLVAWMDICDGSSSMESSSGSSSARSSLSGSSVSLLFASIKNTYFFQQWQFTNFWVHQYHSLFALFILHDLTCYGLRCLTTKRKFRVARLKCWGTSPYRRVVWLKCQGFARFATRDEPWFRWGVAECDCKACLSTWITTIFIFVFSSVSSISM